MSSKPIVLGIAPIVGEQSWKKLGEWAELKVYGNPEGSREDFLQKLDTGYFGDIFAIYRGNESVKVTGLFDPELVNKLPASLKFIGHCGAGYDNINVPACVARGIQISNCPHTTDDAVSDQAIWLMIGALRHAYPTQVALRAGQWRGHGMSLGRDPEGKVLGILGMGSIGQAIAKRAVAFDMSIIYHNRHPVAPEIEAKFNAKFVSMDELLASSDVISLSLAYTPEAYHMLGKNEFAKMKKGVTIVNTARGQMIDEEALIEALDSGKVWSAGLDVFEGEPKVNPKLLKDERMFLAPHLGAGTIDTYLKMEKAAFNNIESALTKGVLVSIIPEQKGKF